MLRTVPKYLGAQERENICFVIDQGELPIIQKKICFLLYVSASTGENFFSKSSTLNIFVKADYYFFH